MTKLQKKILLTLKEQPYKIGHMVGFTKLTKLHNKWIKSMLYGKGDMTLQAHRSSYKTTCVALVLAILLATRPEVTILFIRKTDTDTVEIVKQVQKILLNERFRAMMEALTGQPLTLVTANNSTITTSYCLSPRGTEQLLGIGLGGSLTGKHVDYIFTDDIINRLDRTSKAERERTKAVYQELQNIKMMPYGRIINTGTPWHIEDAFTLMPEPEVYDCYSTGIMSPEEIEEKRHNMSPSLFAANYELKHIAAENALFTTYPEFTADPLLLRDGIAHTDAAYEGEDYTAFTCARRRGDTIYMYGKLWRAHVDTVRSSIAADTRRLMCGPMYNETNADKGYSGREFRKEEGISVRFYQEHMNKYYKISTYLRKWWGHIVFLEGTDPEYIRQILDYSEDAEHDDAPDSAACCCRILDKREVEIDLGA